MADCQRCHGIGNFKPHDKMGPLAIRSKTASCDACVGFWKKRVMLRTDENGT